MSLAKNLKNLMEIHGFNASELARKTDVPQSVINRIMNGVTTNPGVETLKPIASFFSLSINDLIEGNSISIKAKSNIIYTPNSKDIRQIPLLSWREATSWSGRKSVKKRYKMVSTNKGVTDSAFALFIEDEIDSRFPSGTLLLIEPMKKPKNRDYVIIQQMNHQIATLRRYIVDGGTVYLKSIDPDLKTIEWNKNHKILGVVIQSIFDFH